MNRRSPVLALALLLSSCSPDPLPDPEVAVRVEGVTVDPRSNSPVLILEEVEGSRRLPIWIGFGEARSIASVLENQSHPRPDTHDLAKHLIDRLRERVCFFRSADGRIDVIATQPIQSQAPALELEVAVENRHVRATDIQQRLYDRIGDIVA